MLKNKHVTETTFWNEIHIENIRSHDYIVFLSAMLFGYYLAGLLAWAVLEKESCYHIAVILRRSYAVFIYICIHRSAVAVAPPVASCYEPKSESIVS